MAAVKTLYLRIYLTVVAVLLLFALVSGWLVQRNIEQERERFQASASARLTAWAELLQSALPAADEPRDAQAEALLDWSERLRLPLALDDADGRRVATSPSFARITGDAHGPGGSLGTDGTPPARGPGEATPAASPDGPASPAAPRPEAVRRGEPPAADTPPRPQGSGAPPSNVRRDGPPSRWDGSRGRPAPDADGPRREPQRVALSDGRVLWIVRPGGRRPDGRPLLADPPFARGAGLAIALVVLFVAVAAGAWPVVRRLTRRLEALKQGVETFGAGALDHRVDAGGRDEVAALAASFNQAAARIESLVRANQSLLANASHELRSPLARLKMAVEMLESAEPPQRAALRQEIERNIRELDALVEEVLLASRLDAPSGRPREGAEPPPHDPVDLVALAAEEAARVGAALDVPDPASPDAPPASIAGDERLLRRALRNLLENARRYGGAQPPELRLRRVDGRLDVRVLDRGPGVPPAERERIFEPFYRLPGHAEQAGGVGLGLSLVRQIARHHGGEVRCEAREGGGSGFVIELPLRQGLSASGESLARAG